MEVTAILGASLVLINELGAIPTSCIIIIVWFWNQNKVSE